MAFIRAGTERHTVMSARHDTHQLIQAPWQSHVIVATRKSLDWCIRGEMYTMTLEQSQRRNKINSFLSHLNTKLQRQPVFCPKLHRLSGRTWEDHKRTCCRSGCREWSQWPDKQSRSQSPARVVPASRGQFSALIAKSGKQVPWSSESSCWRWRCCSAVGSLRGLLAAQPVDCIRGQGPDTTLACCSWRDTISRQHYGQHYNLAGPRNVRAKLSPTLVNGSPSDA